MLEDGGSARRRARPPARWRRTSMWALTAAARARSVSALGASSSRGGGSITHRVPMRSPSAVDGRAGVEGAAAGDQRVVGEARVAAASATTSGSAAAARRGRRTRCRAGLAAVLQADAGLGHWRSASRKLRPRSACRAAARRGRRAPRRPGRPGSQEALARRGPRGAAASSEGAAERAAIPPADRHAGSRTSGGLDGRRPPEGRSGVRRPARGICDRQLHGLAARVGRVQQDDAEAVAAARTAATRQRRPRR